MTIHESSRKIVANKDIVARINKAVDAEIQKWETYIERFTKLIPKAYETGADVMKMVASDTELFIEDQSIIIHGGSIEHVKIVKEFDRVHVPGIGVIAGRLHIWPFVTTLNCTFQVNDEDETDDDVRDHCQIFERCKAAVEAFLLQSKERNLLFSVRGDGFNVAAYVDNDGELKPTETASNQIKSLEGENNHGMNLGAMMARMLR